MLAEVRVKVLIQTGGEQKLHIVGMVVGKTSERKAEISTVSREDLQIIKEI